MNSKTLVLLILGLVLISSHFVKAHPGHSHSSDEEEHDEDSKVFIMDEDNFEAVVSEHDIVLIKFYAPWCGHCKKLAPAYKEAAEKLASNEKVVIAKVDCTQHEQLCTAHRIEGYPTLIIYNKGKADKYEGGRRVEDIVSYIESELQPPVLTVESVKEIEEFKEKNPLSVVAFFDNDHDDRYQGFLEVVAKNKRNIKFAAVINKDFSSEFVKKTPGAVMYRPFDEPQVVFKSEDFSADELNHFIAINIVPLIGEINGQSYKRYEQLPTSLGYLFVNPKDEVAFTKAINDVKDIAKAVHGKITFCWVDMNKFSQQATHMGLSGKVIPALSIENDKHKFNFPEDGSFTSEEIAKFVNSVAEGKAVPFVKSEPIPEKNDGPVKVVVGKTYEQIVLDETKDVLVEFYAPWCGHCKNLEPIYNQLGELFKDVKSVVIAKIDATSNDVPSELNIKGFPTILLFKADDKANPVQYNGARDTPANFAKFIKDKASTSFDLPKAPADANQVDDTTDVEEEIVESDEEEILIATQTGGKKDTKPSKEHDEL